MSFLRNLYYDLKPYLPDSVRLPLRRRFARRLHSANRDIWPIKPAASQPPPNWPGWPEGKRFAVILTHDVESQVGRDRALALAELESELGFRSSFNFIPEGSYDTPTSLRRQLVSEGFEVGVHDLKHDGKLYRSRREFARCSSAINRYLHDWQACGFRSGFMLHQLDWLHELDISYDMSTFDTDPFEPQPDGVNTIFPFWVPAPGFPSVNRQPSTAHGLPTSDLRPLTAGGQCSPCLRGEPSSKDRPPSTVHRPPLRGGYVELPYTLAQDSTLFLFLEERSIECWTRKLDWIAHHGGMALINVHPDYTAFSGQPARREFPVTLYREFLEHVRAKYDGQYWTAQPKDLASYAQKSRPERPTVSRKRVCMVSYSFYESDNRVMRYADALVKRGDRVDAIALRGETTTTKFEVLNGVNVFRIQNRARNEKNKLSFLLRLTRFLVHSSLFLARRQFAQPYDVVHVHNVPDFLVFTAWLPKLFGARVILDIHDIVPEFFASKFGPGSMTYIHLLEEIERLSCSFADHVIISNHLWYDRITHRSVPPEKCSVLVNYVDRDVFFPRTRHRQDQRPIAIFPGGLQSHQGLDIAIRAFAHVIERHPAAEFHIYGDGSSKAECVALVSALGLQKHVFFFNPIPMSQVADRIANADIGLVPKRADSFGNEAYSTKIMEFMSQGIPVVASRTKIDAYYFSEHELLFFESGNPEDMAEKILRVLKDKTLAQRLAANGIDYVARNCWEMKKQEYFDIVDQTGTRNFLSELNGNSPLPAALRPLPSDL